ncbi:MAG: AEC family transporter [Opitutaceae bacterium]
MIILDTLLPVFAIIALGGVLARTGFLPSTLLKDLNRLAYYVGLPVLIFHGIAVSHYTNDRPLIIFAVIFGASLVSILVAYLVAFAIRLPWGDQGTFVHAAFRGNLVFLGLPVIIYAAGGVDLATTSGVLQLATLSIAPMIILNNVLGAAVLSISQHRLSLATLKPVLTSLVTNPFFIASVAGLLFSLSPLTLPSGIDRTLRSLGLMGVPIALLCVGGTLVTTRVRDRIGPSVTAALIKTLVTPLAGWMIARWLNLGIEEMRIALIFVAAPSAAGGFIMTVQMGGDPRLASAPIAISTAITVFTFAAILYLT